MPALSASSFYVQKRAEEEARKAAVARVEKADDKEKIAREQAAKEAAR